MSGFLQRLGIAIMAIIAAAFIIAAISEGTEYALRAKEMVSFYKIGAIAAVAIFALAFIVDIFSREKL